MKRKVFISYHHDNDQEYKDKLIKINNQYEIFIDMSVDTGDISEELPDEKIREKIRDEYLKDSSVLVLLVGKETKYRKHIDWELYSSMYDGKINKKLGILIVNLPSINSSMRECSLNEKQEVFTDISEESWKELNTREEYKRFYPFFSERIIDNFVKENVKISVVDWRYLEDTNKLKLLIDNAYEYKKTNEYDLSRPMRRKNN